MGSDSGNAAQVGTVSAGGRVQTAAGAPTAEHPWPISELGEKLHDYIGRLGQVWVEGEVTQWQRRATAIYGKLKDLRTDATISVTVWSSRGGRVPDDIAQGDRVAALVKPDYWVKGGTLNMIVSEMRHVGLGDLLERLQQLRLQLTSEGLFDASRKKRLPFLPNCIGLITGADSDAEKDVLRNAALRWPQVRFRVIHTAVQGDRVPDEVTAAIKTLDSDPEVDVIIIARGGGDFLHLLGFSDERVLRAAAAATTPIVSAIGHENDRPLLDEVADLRASTPTDAAKRVVPDVGEELVSVSQARIRLASRMSALLRAEHEKLTQYRSRPVLASPAWIVEAREEEVLRLQQRADDHFGRVIERGGAELTRLRAHLIALSPLATLARGYAIVRTTGAAPVVVRQPSDAPDGTRLELILEGGRVEAVSAGTPPTGAGSAPAGASTSTDADASTPTPRSSAAPTTPPHTEETPE